MMTDTNEELERLRLVEKEARKLRDVLRASTHTWAFAEIDQQLTALETVLQPAPKSLISDEDLEGWRNGEYIHRLDVRRIIVLCLERAREDLYLSMPVIPALDDLIEREKEHNEAKGIKP